MKVMVKDLGVLFVEGVFVSEDDRYITLSRYSDGVHVDIPQHRVITIERSDSEKKISGDNTPKKTGNLKPTIANQDPSRGKNNVAELLRKYNEAKNTQSFTHSDITNISRISQIDPEEEVIENPSDRVEMEIIFTGAKEGKFSLSVPQEVVSGKYTPSLGRQVFSSEQVRAFTREVMVMGVPDVSGNTVTYNTVEVKSDGDKIGMTEKLALAGKAIAATTSFSQGKEASKPESKFALTHDPFEKLPELSLSEKVDKDSNESS